MNIEILEEMLLKGFTPSYIANYRQELVGASLAQIRSYIDNKEEIERARRLANIDKKQNEDLMIELRKLLS